MDEATDAGQAGEEESKEESTTNGLGLKRRGTRGEERERVTWRRAVGAAEW